MAGYMQSSQTTEWETPQDLFNKLDQEFGFTLDVAASPANAKCTVFFTREQNGLAQSWAGETCWCNPPYGQAIADWVNKAASESQDNDATVVMLLPARTDCRWFHEYIWDADGGAHQPRPGVEVRLLRGRLRFGGAKASAPFPSMIVVFRPATAETLREYGSRLELLSQRAFRAAAEMEEVKQQPEGDDDYDRTRAAS